MTLHRLADGLSSADIQGMSLDPQAQDPGGYQSPRDLVSEPATDEQDPATPGGPSPYNGAEPTGQPVTTDPMWKPPDEPKKPPYSPTPYTGPGPSVDVTTLHNARRTPMEETMTADLWVLASQDVERELHEEHLVRAKVAAAGIWPFLAGAKSEREFGHRVALVEPELEELFPDTGFRDQVTASLRDDYLLLTGAVIEEHGEATLTAEASTAIQDGGATAREALLATNAQLEAGLSLFDHLAVSEPDEPESTGTATQGNPAFFDSGPEAGPATGNSGQFAQSAPDPWNPMNAQYPMAPSAWTVPPDAGWVERPMEFGHQAAQQPITRAHASAGYVDEGVQTGPGPNPEYFSAPEGVTNGQDGFPPDVALPEPDERVDSYGSVPPQGRSAARFVVAEKDNHGACAHCNAPVYRKDDTWLHLTGDPGHGVRLHDDHPWIQAQQANRVMASRTAEYQYVKPNPDGDGFVVTQKGTGKVLSHHDTEEDAIASFKAMEMHKHEGHRRVARWVLADVSSSDAGSGAADAASVDPTGAPPAPQSMDPGGAGAIAGPPLTIPNDSVSTHPFAGQNAPQTPSPAPGMGMGLGTTAMRYVADTRNRPTAENPSGVDSGDEFDANNWEAPAQQRPRQDPKDRGINTPQKPGQPIPVRSSESEPGEDDEDEEERR